MITPTPELVSVQNALDAMTAQAKAIALLVEHVTLLLYVEEASRRLDRVLMDYMTFPRRCDKNDVNTSSATLRMRLHEVDEFHVRVKTELSAHDDSGS
jgi:hypothetical protein